MEIVKRRAMIMNGITWMAILAVVTIVELEGMGDFGIGKDTGPIAKPTNTSGDSREVVG